MVRKVGLFILVLGMGHVTLLTLRSVGLVPPDGAAKAVGATATQVSTDSPGQFIVRDAFDDNLKGTMWRVLADDPNNCTMKEVNQRLELQATSRTANATAGYVSSGWRLDPRHDFSMKVDYHYDLMSFPGGWVSLGVTPDVGDPWEKNAAIGVGCADGYAHYWHRKQAGLSVQSSSAQRTRTNGTLYISYNAGADELYLALSAYGPDDAWAVLPGLVRGEWGSRPVFIWLAGGSDGLAVSSGPVYLDSLLVETGTILETSLKEVYRFWSPVLERHFYTISEAEKEMLLTQFPTVWSYEGVVYHSFATDSDLDTRPVYRFWSDKLSSHFYTLSETEKDWLIAQYAHVWTFEGVAFYAYPVGGQPATARPVYRFWSPAKGAHFYTMSETERSSLVANYSSVWMEEGIAWYASE
jgi:hypothetical protein